MKYKVGDKVRVLDGSGDKSYRGTWVSSMHDVVDTVCTITDVLPPYGNESHCGYLIEGSCYTFDERYLEPAGIRQVIINIPDKGFLNDENGWCYTSDKTILCRFNLDSLKSYDPDKPRSVIVGDVIKTDEYWGIVIRKDDIIWILTENGDLTFTYEELENYTIVGHYNVFDDILKALKSKDTDFIRGK